MKTEITKKIYEQRANVLLIEDDRLISRSFKMKAEEFANIDQAFTFNEALKKLKLNEKRYDIVFVDLNLTPNLKKLENEGLQLIPEAKNTGATVVVLSSIDDLEVKRKAMDLGASHYYVKQKLAADVVGHLKPLILSSDSRRINLFFTHQYKTFDFELIERFKEVVRMGLNFSDHVIIKGPTGVGKSLLAKSIHLFCGYPESDFFHLSIGDMKDELIESELFGHKKGSFTGATENKIGLLERCNEKTLFIDDIDLLDSKTQGKLLVFLSHGTFSRVGETTTRKSKIRLITATNQDVEVLIDKKSFREDFYSRINKREILIKPLAERRDDIQLLLEDYIKNSSPEIIIDEPAKKFLIDHYDYPRNVRELEGVVADLQSIEGRITLSKLPKKLLKNKEDDLKSKIRVTKAMQQFAEEQGLNNLIDYIEEFIVSEALKKNEGKYTPARNDLKLSGSKIRGIIKRIDEKNMNGGNIYA